MHRSLCSAPSARPRRTVGRGERARDPIAAGDFLPELHQRRVLRSQHRVLSRSPRLGVRGQHRLHGSLCPGARKSKKQVRQNRKLIFTPGSAFARANYRGMGARPVSGSNQARNTATAAIVPIPSVPANRCTGTLSEISTNTDWAARVRNTLKQKIAIR